MTRSKTLPVLALTMGDPVGVGPEVVARAVTDAEVRAVCRPIVVGSPAVLRRAAQVCGLDLDVHEVDGAADAEQLSTGGTVAVVNPASASEEALLALPLGQVSAEAGRASIEWVLRGIDLTVSRQSAGIVTAPINKEAMNSAGFRYAGHTELLAERTGTREAAMMLVTGQLRVAHVTTHVALERVPALITADRLATVFELTHTTLRQLGITDPRIAVAGLNPHAGEHGLFGNQEAAVVEPAIAAARSRGWTFSGPWPPDTIFARANRGQFDGVIAMYHDQGHIAIKMVGFDEGVNISLGLPIVRTSVDHGTAFDIAGKGIARPVSMIQATVLAAQLASARGLA
ncbi:MAG TPA: 4-hydroxythreonine-4-phosphate dehydrogenase PdxA [Chloroflexota bacterium]|nr:4-hydroxythreonine-4-phosphate dehydrogenase PdxA [Chloroflexota bacterium]